MNRKLVYILVLIALGFMLTVAAKYLPIPVVVGALFIIVLISLTRVIISVRKKAATYGQLPTPQKVSGTIIYSSAFGVIVALTLIVFHRQHIGRPLLNFSLFLYIMGAVTGIIALIKSRNNNINPGMKRQTILFSTIVYLGAICTVAGILLGINRYPGGKLLMFGGVSFALIVPIFLIIYKKYTDEKDS